jgi:hypothetical protein
VQCQWPVLLPFDFDDPKLLPGVGVGVDCGLGVFVLHVELSVPGPALEPGLLFRLTDRCKVVFVAGDR